MQSTKAINRKRRLPEVDDGDGKQRKYNKREEFVKLHDDESPFEQSEDESEPEGDQYSSDEQGTRDGDGSEDSEDDDDAQQQIADIPLGQLVELKANGSSAAPGLKARTKPQSKSKKKSFSRESKHRPQEMSSKRPIPVLRDVFQTGKQQKRDPRFDSLSAGRFSDDKFKKRYSFLYDEQLPEERKQLKESLQKVKSQHKKEEIKKQLSHVSQQIRNEEYRRKKAASEKGRKDKEKEAIKAGKQPYYLKKSEKRKQDLLEKYEELKKSGKLESYMEKRRKRNAAKDHRLLPVGRRID